MFQVVIGDLNVTHPEPSGFVTETALQHQCQLHAQRHNHHREADGADHVLFEEAHHVPHTNERK